MYAAYFGLTKYPFSNSADPDCVYLTRQHREAITAVSYAILQRKGLLVLSGDIGTGKTTVLGRVLKYLPADSVRCSVILHPMLSADEFLETTLVEFGIGSLPASKPARLTRLREFLLEASSAGKTAALVIDEAHKLSPNVLEEVRLLGNHELGGQKLLQIILCGQTELDDLLRSDSLRQLKQRVALRVALTPLKPAEVHKYVQFRWLRAGGTPELPFTAAALDDVAAWSAGFPRLINALCDQALLQALAEQTRTVTPAHVIEAAKDLDLLSPPMAHAAAAKTAAISAAPVAQIARFRVPEFSGYGRRKTSTWSRWTDKIGLTRGDWLNEQNARGPAASQE